MRRVDRPFALGCLLLAVLTALAFLPGLPGAFVFDDYPNLVDNPRIQLERPDAEGLARVVATPQLSGFMRALPTLTFALDYWRAGGADPATFKLTNIAIHTLAAVALAWLFRSLLLLAGSAANRAHWIAAALALAWAVHPLQVSSVLYAVQRFQIMGTLFLLLALGAYTAARHAQMEGRPGRSGMMAAALFWVLALGCKEDSVLLPAYTFALELTVFRFAAARQRTAIVLRRIYLFMVLAGLAAFALLVLPHYWHWDAYPGRDYSTPERLLTQARVLCMYLGQILLPLPGRMPFFYDWLEPSRGLFMPWTTLPAVTIVVGLICTAWWLRRRLPLFALGVLLFFAAHGITSNVPNLELAFEHRNHFALVGAVLAIGSLLLEAVKRFESRPFVLATVAGATLVALAGTTMSRAHSWRDELSLAQANVEHAPGSARAWVTLCKTEFDLGGPPTPDNPRLDRAIAACEAGAAAAPLVLNNATLLLVLKSLRGDASAQEWASFRRGLQTLRMGPENQMATLVLLGYAREGVKMNKNELLATIASYVERNRLPPFALASLGYFVMNDLSDPDHAITYFAQAIEASPPGDPFPRHLGAELQALGRPDLARQVEALGVTRDERRGQ